MWPILEVVYVVQLGAVEGAVEMAITSETFNHVFCFVSFVHIKAVWNGKIASLGECQNFNLIFPSIIETNSYS